MSPTVFRESGFRFFFFSREEPRPHVHVAHADGEAKYWMDPRIELARTHGLTTGQLSSALALIPEHQDEIRNAWNAHFGQR